MILFLLIALSFSPLLTSARTNSSTTIYVDDDNTQGPWDGSPTHPHQFIQDGIDAAGFGDTVFVYGGFYNEQIIIDKTLTLQGESMEDTIIDGTGLGRLCTIQETTNAVISGFTFQHAEPGAEALYLHHLTSAVITQNRFAYNNDKSIYLAGEHHLISENEFINNTYESNTIWIVSQDTTLLNNTITNNNGIGITVVARNSTITGNIIENNKKYGIIIRFVDNIVISQNIIQNNEVGIKSPYNTIGHFITNNIVSENTKAGIFLNSNEGKISNNIIENNSIGILQGYASAFNTISHNVFSSNCIGIQNFDTVSNSYTKNNFIKNTVHASFLNFLPLSSYGSENFEFDSWNNNYWDNWRIDLPKPIFGLYCVVIPFCLFDKNPASEPFYI